MRRGFLAPRQADTPPPPPPQPRQPPAFPAPGSLGPGLRFIYAPSADGCDDNLLVLLHGCGDRAQPFAAFARHLRLPQTATLALEGLLEVPHSDGGRGWWQSHDAEGRLLPPEAPPRGASRAQSLARLEAALEALHASGAWRVHLFGFSDGGEAALELAARRSGERRLGGCVAVAAALSAAALKALPAAAGPRTPALLTRGDQDELVPLRAAQATAAALRGELVAVRGKGHAMVSPRWADEARALMTFWAHTLSARPACGAGESLVELS